MDHWANMHFLFPLYRKSAVEIALNLQNNVLPLLVYPEFSILTMVANLLIKLLKVL